MKFWWNWIIFWKNEKNTRLWWKPLFLKVQIHTNLINFKNFKMTKVYITSTYLPIHPLYPHQLYNRRRESNQRHVDSKNRLSPDTPSRIFENRKFQLNTILAYNQPHYRNNRWGWFEHVHDGNFDHPLLPPLHLCVHQRRRIWFCSSYGSYNENNYNNFIRHEILHHEN